MAFRAGAYFEQLAKRQIVSLDLMVLVVLLHFNLRLRPVVPFPAFHANCLHAISCRHFIFWHEVDLPDLLMYFGFGLRAFFAIFKNPQNRASILNIIDLPLIDWPVSSLR